MAGFCASQQPTVGLVRGLLESVDCNVQTMSQLGYRAVSGPDSQLALIITTLLTLYVAIFGLRLLLGLAPLRVGDLTVSFLKIGVVLALATSWPTYQQVVFETLFRGPEELAASIMGVFQPPGSALRGNPFDGLQIAYDQMQSASAFFVRISPPATSPFSGGVPFAAFSLNMSAYVMLFCALGLLLAAKIVLALLLALGPVFIALLMFDATRGLFEGWLRAALAFSLAPLFATLALVVQLTLIEPQLIALAEMTRIGEPDLPAASAAFILTFVGAAVSLAGMIGIGVIALGFRLPWLPARRSERAEGGSAAPAAGVVSTQGAALGTGGAQPLLPRVASVSAAAAALDRRDLRVVQGSGEGPGRLALGVRGGAEAQTDSSPRAVSSRSYRRTAQPHRAASSARRER